MPILNSQIFRRNKIKNMGFEKFDDKTEKKETLITEAEFKEKTNKIIDDILITNIKDSDFSLDNPKDKEFYEAMIDSRKMVSDGDYKEPISISRQRKLKVPQYFESPEGILKEQLKRYEEDINKIKKNPDYLTDDLRNIPFKEAEEIKGLLEFIKSHNEVNNQKTQEKETKLEGEELFKRQIENNSHHKAKNVIDNTIFFLDSLDKYKPLNDLQTYKEELEEVLYRADFEYKKELHQEILDKDKNILQPLIELMKEIDQKEKFTENEISIFRSKVFDYLKETYGIEENRPYEGEKYNFREQKTLTIETTDNEFFNNLIKKVINPGYRINEKMYNFYKALYDKADKDWQKDHSITRSIRPANIIIYKYNKK